MDTSFDRLDFTLKVRYFVVLRYSVRAFVVACENETETNKLQVLLIGLHAREEMLKRQ